MRTLLSTRRGCALAFMVPVSLLSIACSAYAQTDADEFSQDNSFVEDQLSDSAQNDIDPDTSTAPDSVELSDSEPLEADAELNTIQVDPIAESADETDLDEVLSAGTAQLSDVVVTATKRERPVRKIPASIKALSGDDLEKIGARQMSDFLNLVPGINMQESSGDAPRKLAIRGVGPSTTTNQTVGVMLGDIPVSDPYGNYTAIDPDPWDMERVEVLKGPQGSLFGASSLNGMVRFIANPAQLGIWQSRAFAEWKSVSEGASAPAFGASVNAPVGDWLAVRIAGLYEHAPGLIDMDTPGYEKEDADDSIKRMGRISAAWEVTDRLKLSAWVMRQTNTLNEMSFVTNDEGRLERNDSPSPSYARRSFDLASFQASYDLDWASLVSVSGYQRKKSLFDLDATYSLPGEAVAASGVSVTRARQDVDASGYLQELRLVSRGDGPWDWLGGIYFSSYSADVLSDIYISQTDQLADLLALLPFDLGSAITGDSGISLVNKRGKPLNATERAIFGEVSRRIGEQWQLTFGGRLYKSEVIGTVITEGLTSAASSGQASRTDHADAPGQGFSPKISLTYEASSDLLFYSAVSKGFQYGGINVAAVAVGEVPPTFKSSTLWNYEAGLRSDWLDRSLRLDLTAFFVDWTNAQITEANQSGLGGYVANIGAARNKGLESTLRYWTPIPGLTLDVSASYIVSKTAEAFTSAAGNDIPVGSEMPLSPRWQTATTMNYGFSLGAWLANTTLIHSYQGRAWNNIDHESQAGGYNLLDLSFNVTQLESRFRPTVSLAVHNLTDARKPTTFADGAKSQYADYIGIPRSYTRPRTFTIRLSAEFE
jgi:iron complex outermembrane receptor protein